MSTIAAVVLGILIGWLIEWVIDWVYWRNRMPEAPSRTAAIPDRTEEYDALLLENSRLKSQLEMFTSRPDDLKIIKGIGPEIERRLNRAGITTFAQLSQLTTADLRNILGDVIDRLSDEESLLAQARTLAGQQ